MAARKVRGTAETGLDPRWRRHIQTSMLLKRLNENVKSQAELMTQGQIASAKILLGKVLPDLKAAEITGHDGGPIEVKWRD